MKHSDELFGTTLRMTRAVCIASLLVAACGPKPMIGPEPNEPGTQPHEQGAAQHLAAAKLEAERLEQHKKLYDPRAQQFVKRCDPTLKDAYPATPICWIETINPTAVHLKEIEEHRMRAVEHRKAARELRDVEERACAGVADEDRDISPFSHREDILGVNPLEEAVPGKRERRVVGATILFRKVTHLTGEQLQSIVNCHLARNAVIGHDVASAAMAQCPLTERGARASVRTLDRGFAVDVRADDALAAQAIWRRAQGLAAVEPKKR
jgi:hypothetical protein